MAKTKAESDRLVRLSKEGMQSKDALLKQMAAVQRQLKEIQAPETVPDAAAAALVQQLSGEVKRDVAGEFTAALRRRFPVEIKRAELDRLF